MIYDSSSNIHRNIILDAIIHGKRIEQRVYPSFVNFIEFIEKQNGKYVLTYGTLLGCIRENKQTLWDDDFDIFMFENDMNIFDNYIPSLKFSPFYYSSFINCPKDEISLAKKMSQHSMAIVEAHYDGCDLIVDGVVVPDYGPDYRKRFSITSVTLPEGLQSIGANAFRGCPLTSVTLPESLQSIGANAFCGCIRLTSVTLPDSLQSIGANAFCGCPLTSVTLPEGLQSIGANAFRGCPLTCVTLPEILQSIGADAFSGCPLTSITLPESLQSIVADAFRGCNSITYVTFVRLVDGGERIYNTQKCIPDKDIIYKFQYGYYNYIITKNKNDFYQVWNVNNNNKIKHKVADIFYEKYYQKNNKPYYNSITTEIFNGRLYYIPSNYHEILESTYGDNYMNEYVCCNHSISSYYLDKNKEGYLITTRDDYNCFFKMLLLRSELKTILLSELKTKFTTRFDMIENTLLYS